MKIVALSGWKGSGKDMIADYLMRNHDFQKLSFASLLKDMAAEQYGVPRSHFDDRDLKEAPILDLPATSEDKWSDAIIEMVYPHLRTKDGQAPSGYLVYKGNAYAWSEFILSPPKEALRLYHTPRSLAVIEGSTKRSVASNYWVKAVLGEVETWVPEKNVISDLRYQSEARQLAEAVGRENVVFIRVERFESTESLDPSERDLDSFDFDFVINNKESEGKRPKDAIEQVLNALYDSSVLEIPKLV